MKALMIGVFHDSKMWVEEANKLGISVVGIYKYDKPSEEVEMFESFHVVPKYDIDSICMIALEEECEFIIPLPATNECTKAMCMVNSKLGFKGVKWETAGLAADKLLWHQFLEEKDLMRVKWFYEYDENETHKYEFPCIVKPRFGAGSAGIKKIYSEEELITFMREKDEDNGYRLFGNEDSYLVQELKIEKYVGGITGFVRDGKFNLVIWYCRDQETLEEVHKLPYWYFETCLMPGDPRLVSEENLAKIQHLCEELQLEDGCFRADVLWNEDMELTTFIEVNLRPGSGAMNYVYEEVMGFDTYAAFIKAQTDLPINMEVNHKNENRVFFGRNIRLPNNCTIKKLEFPEQEEDQRVLIQRKFVGDKISSWNASEIVAESIFVGKTPEDVIYKDYLWLKKVKVLIE